MVRFDSYGFFFFCETSSDIWLIQEASLADITYLFESGALMDFEIGELVRLVQGLFADTPLRAKTVDKIMAGQPSFTQE